MLIKIKMTVKHKILQIKHLHQHSKRSKVLCISRLGVIHKCEGQDVVSTMGNEGQHQSLMLAANCVLTGCV
jgi:hypothetical protein